jgi:predicted RNA binding protein YcfA (HicA-like mRNA interferase family)
MSGGEFVSRARYRIDADIWNIAPTANCWCAIPPTVRQMLELLKDDGWIIVTTRGSHRQLKHPRKKGLVTVAGKPSDDLAPGTENSILTQAGLKD